MSVVEQAIDRIKRNVPVLDVVESTVRQTPPRPEELPPLVAPSRMVIIDLVKLRATGYLPEPVRERQFIDCYRRIKRPLIDKALAEGEDDKSRLIMLASALPGDGKTFTSINLAFSMARERDSSVVLVDADVAKPHISRIFGLDQEPGLLEALNGDVADVESLVLPTSIPGLSILPAGKLHEVATELLASERMIEVTRRLNARDPKRITLFDSAPMLVSNESRVLAGVTGQLVLVVRAGKTPRQAVLDAIAQAGEGRSISLVLNHGRAGDSDGSYGVFGYGYGYDSDAQKA
jgi:exopolysaccharide/PEP-CTERM locus tyrosine autokinase